VYQLRSQGVNKTLMLCGSQLGGEQVLPAPYHVSIARFNPLNLMKKEFLNPEI
jgi:hypothetical protein